MLRRSVWNVRPGDPRRATALASRCGLEPLVGQLLLNRGVDEPHEVRRFLSPSLEALDDPWQLPDMAEAVDRILRAIKTREPVLVFGDSDVDGITAATILYETLSQRGAKVLVRLSNRLADGYGFPKALISRMARLGIKLLILVDCGTNQAEEIRALARHGIETIILDHHVPSDTVAKPLALVNPYRGEGAGRELCSAGLALKLAQALWADEPERLASLLDLAALGTLADCAPLIGQNRVLVSEGSRRLLTTSRRGLMRLCQDVGMSQPTPEQILRRLIPRLNAAGRLGNPRSVFRLFVASTDAGSDRLIEVLGAAHAQTKALSRQMLAEAHEQVNRIHFKEQLVMVIGRQGWHPGLMGPLAAQLADRYARPAIAIALDGRIGVGSGRSPSAFNLLEVVRACERMVVRYGGHPQACGLTISSANLEQFREAVNRRAQAVMGRENLEQALSIDVEAGLGEMTSGIALTVERFRPFGPGNPKPLVLFRRLTLRTDGGETWLTDGRSRARVKGRLAGVAEQGTYDVVASPILWKEALGLLLYDARATG